ncbi:MAG TPA: hypothetical protein VF355_00150 [Anaerolineaceae bacterium]
MTLDRAVDFWRQKPNWMVRKFFAILARAMVHLAHVPLLLVFPCAGERAFEVDLVDHDSSPFLSWVLNGKRHIVRLEMLRTNVASLANEE